jgi:4-hydroxy-tetrahydrodipicolinate synthase
VAEYPRADARDWAREHLTGVNNVIIPSFTNDLKRLNEQGIRHDVRREIELGFAGALLVSETATTLDEYITFVEVAADEANGKLRLIHHASFNTLEENIDMARRAAEAGAQLTLLAYPPNFFPTKEEEIYEYTRAFTEATDLGVILFPVPLWGFEGIHGASLSPDLIGRLIDECPTVVAVKAEGGFPSTAGFAHLYYRYSDKVIIEMPVESHAIPLASLVPIQCMATSNSEYYGPWVPRMWHALQDDKVEEAFSIFWMLHPARVANEKTLAGTMGVFNFAHRMVWKYQAWLAGFNGGPLRMPTPRISPDQMRALRRGLEVSGLDVPSESDEAFFIGRNPV